MDDLTANVSILIAAGSETTATLLCGVTLILLKNPVALSNLKKEVRSSFQSEEEITLTSVDKLGFILACLDEAMRMYPPVPIGLPRQFPPSGATIDGHWVPGGVSKESPIQDIQEPTKLTAYRLLWLSGNGQSIAAPFISKTRLPSTLNFFKCMKLSLPMTVRRCNPLV
jgi:hypothetical protein